ncbi:MAG: hypothetical protein Tsb005_05110 [Gammaproteobacteria bacterium]
MAKKKDSLAKKYLRKAYVIANSLATTLAVLLPTRDKQLKVFYGGARAGDVGGPLVKVKRLQQFFPERRLKFSLVYLLSNTPYLHTFSLRALKARKIPIVYNQNGVFYPAWYEGDWRLANANMARAYHLADYVFYQSEFCRESANIFLGQRQGMGEILYNAVDTQIFRPLNKSKHDHALPFTFLITGKIEVHMLYRVFNVLEALYLLLSQGIAVQLIVAGWLSPMAYEQALQEVERLKLSSKVKFIGSYTQENAVNIYNSADCYIMTKHNDPCPNTVLEALACGLPVIYSNSGGVPELVGDKAGIAIECAQSWEEVPALKVEDIANAMLAIISKHSNYAQAARERAVSKFDIHYWIERHRHIFMELLAGNL